MSSGSKFSSIIAAHKQRAEPEAPAETSAQQPEEQESITPPAPVASQQRKKHTPSPTPTGRGRPAGGKRSDPDFTQVTAYVREDTYRKVKIALLQERNPQEFSDLVEQLLDTWLHTQKAKTVNT